MTRLNSLALVSTFFLFLAASRPSEEREIASSINAHLKRFSQAPVQVMSAAPQRWDSHGRLIESGSSVRFPTGISVAIKNQGRARIRGRDASAPISENDRVEGFLDTLPPVRSLEALESMGLKSAAVPIVPWSDDYWPLYRGLIGARYADRDFPFDDPDLESEPWYENFHYVSRFPALSIIRSGDARRINVLSPSEKYEMVIGNPESTLTSAMWSEGERIYKSRGHVPSWIGICHGWAPASIMMPRPTRSVILRAADGRTPVAFYPSDIKALASLLWARTLPSIRFIGGRCASEEPRTDENGRIISPDCFDTNPGTWHVAVTNQIGIAHRSFVMDAIYDFEVWNQPARSYRYRYFNPQSMEYVDTLSEAKVEMKQFSRDLFRRYRSSQTESVVGIAMDFTYMEETIPSHSPTDSPREDDLRTVRYFYDLELDKAGTIIGGEWYTQKHPDFLWVPAPGAHAESVAEAEATGAWTSPESALPESWRKAAQHAAQEVQPLAKIVDQIVSWASNAVQ